MASCGDKATIVVDGDALTDAFCTVWGDDDGHLMPLSPAVRVRYKALCIHCSNYHHFYIFALDCVATCW